MGTMRAGRLTGALLSCFVLTDTCRAWLYLTACLWLLSSNIDNNNNKKAGPLLTGKSTASGAAACVWSGRR